MSARALGRLVALTYDWTVDRREPPAEGDVLLSYTGTAAYRIVAARLVRRREPVPGVQRWAFRCERISRDQAAEAIAGGAAPFDVVWHHRPRTRLRR